MGISVNIAKAVGTTAPPAKKIPEQVKPGLCFLKCVIAVGTTALPEQSSQDDYATMVDSYPN